MKKVIALLIALAMVFALCACGNNPTTNQADDSDFTTANTPAAPTNVSETRYMKIHGICVDDSYVDDDSPVLKMVYLFYTLTANESNLEIDSKYTDMIINGINTYKSDNFSSSAAACKYTSSYYYSSYIENVYLGSSIKVIATFKIPEGDLAPGKTITFSDYQIPGIDAILMSTDDIQHFSSAEKIAEAMDPAGYATEMKARETAPSSTTTAVQNAINGYYWSFYVNSTAYEVEFWAPNNFEVRTAFGSNQGTYSVKNGYIFCTYPSNGYTVEIPYTLSNGQIDLDIVDAFDVH